MQKIEHCSGYHQNIALTSCVFWNIKDILIAKMVPCCKFRGLYLNGGR